MPKLTKALKRGVMVKVISGKEKGKTGKVIRILWEKNRVYVEKVNLIKRHSKPNAQNKQGGIIEKEASMHLSNLKLLEGGLEKPKKTKPTATPAADNVKASSREKKKTATAGKR